MHYSSFEDPVLTGQAVRREKDAPPMIGGMALVLERSPYPNLADLVRAGVAVERPVGALPSLDSRGWTFKKTTCRSEARGACGGPGISGCGCDDSSCECQGGCHVMAEPSGKAASGDLRGRWLDGSGSELAQDIEVQLSTLHEGHAAAKLKAMTGPAPIDPGWPSDWWMARASRLARCEGDVLLCSGRVPDSYDGKVYSDGLSVDVGSGFGSPDGFESGYFWILVGDPDAFTLYILAEQQLSSVASFGSRARSYCGYPIVTRVDGVAQKTYLVRTDSGISWTWTLRIARRSSGPKGPWGAVDGVLVDVGSATVTLSGELSTDPSTFDAGTALHEYYDGIFEISDSSGAIVDSFGSERYSAYAVPNCVALATAWKSSMEELFYRMVSGTGLVSLEAAGDYEGPESVGARHAVYLVRACALLFEGVGSWYNTECSGVQWDRIPNDDGSGGTATDEGAR